MQTQHSGLPIVNVGSQSCANSSQITIFNVLARNLIRLAESEVL
jgi:hypothetical protein